MSTEPKNKDSFPEQLFLDKEGKEVDLRSILVEGDWWSLAGRNKSVTILTHDAVKKIANCAGVQLKKYDILTQPDCYNNYQYTMQCTVECRNSTYIEIGESNRNNLGAKGRGNPANMAQKRAYDRAVLSAVGIVGMLSADELIDDNKGEQIQKVDALTHEELRAIAPAINQILLAKTKIDLQKFSIKMKEKSKNYKDNQLVYLRELFKKKVAELSKTQF